MTANVEGTSSGQVPPLADGVRGLTHPGPVEPLRLAAFRARAEAVSLTIPRKMPLDELVSDVLITRGWTAASGVLESGTLRSFEYSYPIPGYDGRSRVALSPAVHIRGAKIVHGGVTVGARKGAPFAHVHAVFIDKRGNCLGGHLHYKSVVLEEGVRLKLWGTPDVTVRSEPDPEIGVPIFQFNGSNPLDGYTPAGTNALNSVFARVRPNLDLTHAIETLLSRSGLSGKIQIPGQIGSLVGAVFADPSGPRHVAGPVVEVLYLSPTVRRTGSIWRVELVAEIVDSHGQQHRGVLARGRNPVAMTFELGIVASNA